MDLNPGAEPLISAGTQDDVGELPVRSVEVITVPAKDIGPLKRSGLRLASLLLGSTLTWAMHWAIRVDSTYFELHRPRGPATKPQLRTSEWSEERKREIITTVPIGTTRLSDDEIIALSQPYFSDKTSSLYYSLYINNCQLFVQFSLEKIQPASSAAAASTAATADPGVLPSIPPLLKDTIGLMLTQAFYITSCPLLLVYIRWLRWRGCDEANLRAYAALFITGATMIWPMISISSSQMYHMFISIFEREALLIASYSTFMTAIVSSSFIFLVPALVFPVARKRAGGEWDVTTRMKQNNEVTHDTQTDAKIRVTVPVISVVIGGCILLLLWVAVATPYMVRGIVRFLGRRLSFRSPRRFIGSIGEILMTPVFNEGRASARDSGKDPINNRDDGGEAATDGRSLESDKIE